MTDQAPKALAFGDSVMWGQGIKHENKFATRIATNHFGFDFLEDAMLAHSGARLGKPGDRDPIALNVEGERLNGEVPIGRPTIFSQVATYRPDHQEQLNDRHSSPDDVFPEVAVVFLNGGINDIGASELVTGNLGDREDLERSITPVFHDDTLDLLFLSRKRFPNARLMVFGYHFIFSHLSLRSIAGTVVGLESFVDGLPAVKADAIRQAYRRAARQCSLFMSITQAQQQQAIDKFNIEDQGVGSVFVPSLHGAEHAAFAPDSLSWGLRAPTPDALVSGNFVELAATEVLNSDHSVILALPGVSDDEVAAQRAPICNLNVADTGDRAQCVLAGLFHPNSVSARRVENTASQVNSGFSGKISIRAIVGRHGLDRYKRDLGYLNNQSVRTMFATNIISSVRLNGVVLAGSAGDFPYHLMYLMLRLEGDTTVRLSLNTTLPFSRLLEELDKDLFPAATGPLVSSEGESFNTVRDVEQDTQVSFHAFPTEITDIHHVTQISLGCERVTGNFNLLMDKVELQINGRTLDAFQDVQISDDQEVPIFLSTVNL